MTAAVLGSAAAGTGWGCREAWIQRTKHRTNSGTHDLTEQARKATGSMRNFFDPHQRATIEAAMARIIPTTTPRAPARPARSTSSTAISPGSTSSTPSRTAAASRRSAGERAEAWQQRIDILRATYVEGIADLDRRCRDAFGADFVDLDAGPAGRVAGRHSSGPSGGDAATAVARRDAAAPGASPALQQTSTETELISSPLLAMHTRQGFYADPIYGGNKDRVGWKVIGFPGPASLMEVFHRPLQHAALVRDGGTNEGQEANHDA